MVPGRQMYDIEILYMKGIIDPVHFIGWETIGIIAQECPTLLQHHVENVSHESGCELGSCSL